MTFSLKIGENHLFKIRGILFVKHFEIKLCLYFLVSQEKKNGFHIQSKELPGDKGLHWRLTLEMSVVQKL